jgi:DNA-directed RNA polymerase specialized sigma24 family protein
MAKRIGNSTDPDEIFNEAYIRCLRVDPWPSDAEVLSFFMKALYFAKLDLLRKSFRHSKIKSSFDNWQEAIGGTSSGTPEDEIAAQDILDQFFASLRSDTLAIARGRALGLKGKELREQTGLAQARFDAAYRDYERKLFKFMGRKGRANHD